LIHFQEKKSSFAKRRKEKRARRVVDVGERDVGEGCVGRQARLHTKNSRSN
jgi:hypothetical protein